MQNYIFNNAVSVSFREDGFLNATSVASHFGKQPRDYLKTEQNQEYIIALADFLSSKTKILVEENQLVIVKNGGNDRGTWLHPKLAIHFARWLDAKFAVWCDMQIEEILGINQARSNISTEQKQQIQAAVNARHHRTGEHWQTIYTSLHQFLQVSTYHEIAAVDFDKAMQFLNATPNTPAIRLPEKEAMFSDHQLSRFATVVYYCSWMAAKLKAMSEPLKALGADNQGVEAWTLWAESQSWLHECRDALIDVEQRMTSEYFRKRLLESIQKTGRYL